MISKDSDISSLDHVISSCGVVNKESGMLGRVTPSNSDLKTD